MVHILRLEGHLAMRDITANELIQMNQKLLEAIAAGDWGTYQDLCEPSLTSIEPESHGQVVEGLEFHRYYFDLGGIRGRNHTTMVSPKVRLMGDVAVLTYIRLVQRIGPDGPPVTVASAETRVWQQMNGKWKHVHFHRTTLV
jgi:calcium/calmodulin-dependent protein kinase (CaM kinase) II